MKQCVREGKVYSATTKRVTDDLLPSLFYTISLIYYFTPPFTGASKLANKRYAPGTPPGSWRKNA